MNPYEQRQEARRERLEKLAERLRAEGNAKVERAHKMASIIPFGQPILVGHHSERGDRSYRKRIHSGFSKGFETIKQGDEAAARAASVGSGGISADDPDAVRKLRETLARMEREIAHMRAVNAAIRRHKGDLAVAALVSQGLPSRLIAALIEADGYPGYRVTNLAANIRRVRERIATLEARAKRVAEPDKTIGEITIVENAELNRLQVLFPGKPPPEVRSALKNAGFRWAPSEGAWQRQNSNAARYWAEKIATDLEGA